MHECHPFQRRRVVEANQKYCLTYQLTSAIINDIILKWAKDVMRSHVATMNMRRARLVTISGNGLLPPYSRIVI